MEYLQKVLDAPPLKISEMWWGTLGTVRPFPNFGPEEDAREIYTALEKKGADVNTLVRILTNRNNVQRQCIADAFETIAKKELKLALKKALSGALEDLLLALLMTPSQFDAHRLRQSMEGLGTDEEGLLEVLCTRTPKQLSDITVAYNQEFGRNLEKDLISETSKDFTKLVLAILKKEELNIKGVIDYQLIDQDVKALLGGVNVKKTDPTPWIQILTSRSPGHLSRVFTKLEGLKGEPVERTVQNNFSGDLRLGLRILVQTIQSTPMYLAQRLQNNMKKIAIVRGILVARSEEDMLCVRREYRRLTNTSLYSTIQNEFKGEMQQALLALCRSEDL